MIAGRENRTRRQEFGRLMTNGTGMNTDETTCPPCLETSKASASRYLPCPADLMAFVGSEQAQ